MVCEVERDSREAIVAVMVTIAKRVGVVVKAGTASAGASISGITGTLNVSDIVSVGSSVEVVSMAASMASNCAHRLLSIVELVWLTCMPLMVCRGATRSKNKSGCFVIIGISHINVMYALYNCSVYKFIVVPISV